MPANGGSRSAALQTEAPETVAAGKVGQKRRAVLQEVDVNRKSRRGSGGANIKDNASNPSISDKTGQTSDRLLRSKQREKAKEEATKSRPASSKSFQIFHDPVAADEPGAGSSGAMTKNESAQAASARPSESYPDTSSGSDVVIVQNAEGNPEEENGTRKVSTGGWEVLEVEHEGALGPEGEVDGAMSDERSTDDTKKEQGPSVDAEVESIEKEIACETSDVSEKIEGMDYGLEEQTTADTSSEKEVVEMLSVDDPPGQSEEGKEIEGEETVQVVGSMITASPDAMSGATSSSTPRPFDIDSDDRMDQFCVTEYTQEIYAYLRECETRSLVDHDYMSRQNDINPKMRVILNDWLVEVHLKFKLRQETLYLCFQLIDRFLEHTQVRRQKLQLVGVTGLMLASKYEEIYPPEVRDYVYICDNAYTRDEILKMEQTMLARLEYRLSLPTVWSFLKRFCKTAGRSVDKPDDFFQLVSYLIELSMIQIQMLQFKPSMLVASSIYLTNILRKEPVSWTPQLEHHTGYMTDDLESCVGELRSLLSAAPREPKYKAVYKKFTHRQFDSVALLPSLQPDDHVDIP